MLNFLSGFIGHCTKGKNLTLKGDAITYGKIFFKYSSPIIRSTPGSRLMRIHLVRNSTSSKFEKKPNIHLVQPIIHLVRIFALSTS